MKEEEGQMKKIGEKRSQSEVDNYELAKTSLLGFILIILMMILRVIGKLSVAIGETLNTIQVGFAFVLETVMILS